MCNFNNLIQSKVHKVEKIELNAQLAHPATAYSCLLIAWSDKEYHYSPPTGWNVSPSQGYPLSFCFIRLPWQFTSTHLLSWVERGILRVKNFTQEHNT